jgi:DNA-binding NarL/FixJ family response regulator
MANGGGDDPVAKQTKLSIVIADDHPLVRRGLRQLIEAERGFEVAGEAGDGQSALDLIKKINPSIAILDFSMPQLDGIALARRLEEMGSTVKTILITMYQEEKLFKEALKAGVKGYVLKDSASSDIIDCIKAVVGGHNYASPRFTTYLVSRVRQFDSARPVRSALDLLTGAEIRVLSLIAEYKTSKEIAQALFISPRTVETHRNNICQKLDVHGNHGLMKFAIAHKAALFSPTLASK